MQIMNYWKTDNSRSSIRISDKTKEALIYLSGKKGCSVIEYVRNVCREFEKRPEGSFTGFLRDHMLCELLKEVRK